MGQLDYTHTTSYSMASVIFSMKYTTACTDLVFAQRDIFQLSLGVIRPIRAKITSILRSQNIKWVVSELHFFDEAYCEDRGSSTAFFRHVALMHITMEKYCSGPVRISYSANLVFHSVRKKTRCKQKLALSFSLPLNFLTILFFSSKVRNSYLARHALSLSPSPYNFLPSYAFWR